MNRSERKPNRLIDEKSPYLLQHAENPVDWYPWGVEAFAKAKKESKPIFLSVGYSTCHWCHVMERESFEDPRTALLLNTNFVPVKVDREEYPDLDRLYMTFVQSTTGRGGWPMSVWLTPDLDPFYGGSYFPPVDRYGMPGFNTLLTSIARLWQTDPQSILDRSALFFQQLNSAESVKTEGSLPSKDAANRCFRWLEDSFDRDFGGFGNAPKFPRPVLLDFLFNYHYHTGNEQALAMALFTLRKMAEGGIHDHLGIPEKGGGGFSRYSTDPFWHLPHFEKMLYDNAQLAISFVQAFQCSGDSFYAEVADDIFNYVLTDLASSEGAFYSAEDADSLPEQSSSVLEEGAFYRWSHEEVLRLPCSRRSIELFSRLYGIRPEGNVLNDPHNEFAGLNILKKESSIEEIGRIFSMREKEVAEALEEVRLALHNARLARPRPFLDDKILASWNGLMISALARGYRVFGDKRLLLAANRATEFLLSTLYNRHTGKLLRRYRNGSAGIDGKADDYAFFVQGLLDLYEADFDPRHIETAIALTETVILLFEDTIKGGFSSTASDDTSLPARMREEYDGAEPAANSVLAMNLLRLSEMTGEERYNEKAENIFKAFDSILDTNSHALPAMLVALNFWEQKKSLTILNGDPASPVMQELKRAPGRRYLPGNVTIHASIRQVVKGLDVLEQIEESPAIPRAYVCLDRACQLPVSDPISLMALLSNSFRETEGYPQ
ncbi:thioredoxin domain-containing protein [Chlorobium phaeobacteroides]|uniref:Spermatogenesis-associated protein 20-like TRX domain-containing protein n=1 Tax=Chlorobium phaeobacteroides (strain DSM 266 / SMG 266 / 2430) TaxID=290317 RepID=A1BGG1_CHLPD|nr:thioredoxin domain-containing protein [Chlorobium phaeobacteroides]ABL65488.1 protein of unknown function DUF255 [Chlorobium phaeobacteroides DSM 266]